MGTTPHTMPPTVDLKPRKIGTTPAGVPTKSPSIHLDALRGFAAFSVLLNHWRDAFFVDYGALLHHNLLITVAYMVAGLGHQWVIVFFVMSGYLVGGSVLRSMGTGRWSWRSYLLARLTRLYVVLLPALLLGGMLDWAGMHMQGTAAVYGGQSGMHALVVNVHKTATLPTLLENGLFLQTIALPGNRGSKVPTFGTNGPLWSLCNEFWYYIAFPLLALLLVGRGSLLKRSACCAALLAWGWFLGPSIVLLGIPWLMGVLIAVLPPFPSDRSWLRGAAVAVALFLVAAGLVWGKLHDGTLTSDLILGGAVTVLIWVLLHCATAPLPSVYAHVARRAARSSYTLYLVHFPLVVFLKASLHLGRVQPGRHALLIAALLLLVVNLYAQGVYQLFEKNTDRIRKWIKNKQSERDLNRWNRHNPGAEQELSQ